VQVHDQLLPTVYTLWRCPDALPSLLTYSEVSSKVSRVTAACLRNVSEWIS